MPVDNIVQGGVTPIRAATSTQASSTRPVVEAKVRQELPVKGNSEPPPEAQDSPKQAELKQAVSNLNDYVQSLRRDLQFSIDETSGHTVVKVVDPDSGTTIRQIPSEEALAISRSLEQAMGLLLSTKV